MKLGIADIAYVFGDQEIDNAKFGREHGFDESFIADKLGITSRHITTAEQSSSDLAVAAVTALLERSKLRPDEIGFLMLVTQTPDHLLPHTAALVQDHLGLPVDTPTFDLNLGCSGYVYGLSVATSFMMGNGIKRGILVTADTYSKWLDQNDRATAPLFSDAATATLITDTPVYTPGRFVFGTDGSGADALMINAGGSRNPHQDGVLYMNGRAIFGFAMKKVPLQIKECLRQNEVAIDTIDKFVFHQANKFMLDSVAQGMRLSPSKVLIDIKDKGNSVSSTIPIALTGLLRETEIANRVLICGFGVGLSWATTILFRCK